MNILPLLLQIAALVFLFFAMFSMVPNSRVTWGWAGMFLWLLSLMVGGIILHPVMGTH